MKKSPRYPKALSLSGSAVFAAVTIGVLAGAPDWAILVGFAVGLTLVGLDLVVYLLHLRASSPSGR